MERWKGKVAVITGASSGIGLMTAKELVKHGIVVVGLARRKTQMEEKMRAVQGSDKFHAVECDITKEEDVTAAFDWIKKTLGFFNILINNAGIIKYSKIEDTPSADLEQIINVNLMGLLYCSKHAIKLMRESQVEAHIININSVLGHMIPSPLLEPPFNVYPATKFAVRALSETLKNELLDSKIRVTNISPGLVKTEMWENAAKNNERLSKMAALESEDVSNAVVYVLGAPPRVEINELKLTAKDLTL